MRRLLGPVPHLLRSRDRDVVPGGGQGTWFQCFRRGPEIALQKHMIVDYKFWRRGSPMLALWNTLQHVRVGRAFDDEIGGRVCWFDEDVERGELARRAELDS